jgi:hypothetical protein
MFFKIKYDVNDKMLIVLKSCFDKFGNLVLKYLLTNY